MRLCVRVWECVRSKYTFPTHNPPSVASEGRSYISLHNHHANAASISMLPWTCGDKLSMTKCLYMSGQTYGTKLERGCGLCNVGMYMNTHTHMYMERCGGG